MWRSPDNQEVGLEAAILQRKRNSSLVKFFRAVNITGLSIAPKLEEPRGSVGERSGWGEGGARATLD
jgi:hypothetical protein